MTELQNISNNFVVPSRTNYQIEKFVIGRHDTPEMQYRQILIESQSLIYNIKDAELLIKKTELEIAKLQQSDNEIDKIEAERKKLGLTYTMLTLEGAKRELAFLEKLFNELPKYTPDQIEANQPEYWQKRLQRQADVDVASAQGKIGADNVQSMLDIGLLHQVESVSKKELI